MVFGEVEFGEILVEADDSGPFRGVGRPQAERRGVVGDVPGCIFCLSLGASC